MLAFAYSILYPGASLLLLGALQVIIETVTVKTTKNGKISSPNEHNALKHYSHFPPPNKSEEWAMSWKQVCAGGRSQSLHHSTPCYSDPIKQIPHYAVHAQTIPATPAHLSLQHALPFFFLTQTFLLEASAYAEDRDNWYLQKLEGKTLILNIT